MNRYLLLAALAASVWAQPVQILSPEELQQLETKVAHDPSDLKSQALLGKNYALLVLGITSLNKLGIVDSVDLAQAESAAAQHARHELSTSQLAGIVGEGGNALWNYTFEVQGFQASRRMQDASLVDPRILATQCIDRAISLEPHNGIWRSYRIPELILRSNSKIVLPLSVAEAYGQVKQDLAEMKGRERSYMLGYAAKIAITASAFDDAQALAEELLKSAPDLRAYGDYGDATFFGNTALGLVAIHRGNLDSAKSYLLASAKNPGSPVLGSFGPSMSLAKAVLEHGDRETVLEFFDLCGKFWKNNRGKLAQWTDQVRAGNVPNFGANLIY